MKRWLLIGGGLVILIIIVVVIYLYSSLDSLIKTAVEKYGSEITQAQVRLNEVEVSVTSGQGALRGLNIGNPKGFRADRAFRLGEISLSLDVGTVTSDTIIIKEIAVSAPEVTYELGPQGSNIDAIKRNVEAYTGTGRSQAEAKSPPKNEGKGPRLVIENLYIRDGKVGISSSFSDKTLSAKLPDIHLTNIGKQKGGATPGEVAEKLIDSLSNAVASAVAKVDTSEVLGRVKEEMGAARETIEGKGKGTVDTLKNIFGK